MQEVAKTLNADAGRDTRQRLAHYMLLTGLSNREIASSLGLPSDVQVARYLDGLDEPNLDIAGRVAKLFNLEPDGAAWEGLPFDNTVAVWELCRLTVKHRRMAAIEGDSGYGKTSALRLYSRLVGAIHYEYDEVSGCRDALRKMCQIAGIPHVHRALSIGGLRDLLLAKLRKLGLPLIVDQFDTAPFRLVEAVRGMWDEARVPVIIAGLDGRLTDRLQRRNAHENCVQILSRLSYYLRLNPPSAHDVDLLCDCFDIDGRRAREWLLRRGAVGGYRIMRVLCEDAQELAKLNGLRRTPFKCLQEVCKYVKLAADSVVDDAAPNLNHPEKGE